MRTYTHLYIYFFITPSFFLIVKSPNKYYNRLRTTITKYKNNLINIARVILVNKDL